MFEGTSTPNMQRANSALSPVHSVSQLYDVGSMVTPVPYVHRKRGAQDENSAIWMNKFAIPLFFCQRFEQFNPTLM